MTKTAAIHNLAREVVRREMHKCANTNWNKWPIGRWGYLDYLDDPTFDNAVRGGSSLGAPIGILGGAVGGTVAAGPAAGAALAPVWGGIGGLVGGVLGMLGYHIGDWLAPSEEDYYSDAYKDFLNEGPDGSSYSLKSSDLGAPRARN